MALQFDTVRVVPDDTGRFFHTFLIPSEGYQAIINLHYTLYSDNLASELRADIPFIPHLTIGMSQRKGEMDELAKRLMGEKPSISGVLNALTIIEFNGSTVTDYQRIELE